MNIYLEIFGYIGTAIVIVSMMMTSVVKLRLFNIGGGIISTIYAVHVAAWPVVVLNVCLITINSYQVIRLARTKSTFAYVQSRPDDQLAEHFYHCYETDIKKIFPQYTYVPDDSMEIHAVYAGAEAVALLIGKREGESLRILLDYASPKYRDCSVAKFLFSQLEESGIKTFIADKTEVTSHQKYLRQMQFEAQGDKMIRLAQA